MTFNEKEVTAKLRRIDICDLLIACTVLYEQSDGNKWSKLHDKLEYILEGFDEKEMQR